MPPRDEPLLACDHRFPRYAAQTEVRGYGGLDDRQRDADSEIRKKRSDTLVGTLRREYGPGFAAGFRSDAKLGTVLKREGVPTLGQSPKKR
jgi:hypothetical protein